MHSDTAYQTKAIPVAKLLYEASHGDFASIPEVYSEYLNYDYSDGDISLLGILSKFSLSEEGIEPWELVEVFEELSKVDPLNWPDPKNIQSLDIDLFYRSDENVEEVENTINFVEDNLGTSDKVHKVLTAVLRSVFKGEIESIRDRAGNFPSSKNNFLLERDGTFSGVFKSESFTFLFEILPTEKGWVCTYRMNEKSLDSLERKHLNDKQDKKTFKQRTIRSRGW